MKKALKEVSMEKSILTPEHKSWWAFSDKLHSALDPFDDSLNLSKHLCQNDLQFCTDTLENLGDIDVEGTLEHFKNMGGHCDCKVYLNVVLKHHIESTNHR